MSYQPYYIASFENESGLNQYFEPFLIPEKAFPTLEDAYAWRGRIKRRLAFDTLGRLRRKFTAASLGLSLPSPWLFNIYTTLAAPIGPITGEPQSEIETAPFAVPDPLTNRLTIVLGAITFVDQGDGTLTSVTPGNAGTIDYLTGDITLTHTGGIGAATTVTFAYFPALPVMGLPNNLTDSINEENLRAFDTKYAYRFTSGHFEELPAVTPTVWNGNDSDFFWTTTYWPMTPGANKLMWTTNFNVGSVVKNPLRYYDPGAGDWTAFSPFIDSGHTQQVFTCRCIIPYKNRLLMFNTLEGTALNPINYPQRLRYSKLGNPLVTADVDAWVDNVVGKGGFVDVPSDQAIISVEFIKDVLIVKLERSSWKIIYTGNETFPFYFEKVNTELGAESTFSLVPFDRGVLSVGNVGICTDDSVNVSRIDQKIPDTVFNIRNADNGPKRVHGIRDFETQLVYWAFPNFAEDRKFPNKVLVYNYLNDTYSIFNDSFTCYGYFQRSTSKTWAEYTNTTWNQANFTWNSGLNQSQFPNVVAGNQQGFVLVLNQDTFNDVSLAINDINLAAVTNQVVINSVNHNLQPGQFVKLTGILGNGAPNPTVLNDQIYKVVPAPAPFTNTSDFALQVLNLAGDFEDVILAPGGNYLGMGRIIVLNNINITTKVFAPFYEDNGQVRLGYIDFLFDKTLEGELTCDVYINEEDVTSISDPNVTMSGLQPTSGILGSNTVKTSPENLALIPYQANQKKIWHRMFIQSIAENFQLVLRLSDLQMVDEIVNGSDIQLHAMAFYISKNARLTQ